MGPVMTKTSVALMKNYIGGKWVEAEASGVIDINNPSTGEVIGQVPLSTKAETDRAIKAAYEAYKTWGKTPVARRVQPLFKLAQLLFTLLVFVLVLRADDISAFTLGPLLVFAWLVVNAYYWNMLGFLALGLALRRERASFGALLGLHAILALFYLYEHTNHGYAEGYFVALLFGAFTVAFAAAEAVAAWRSRQTAAVVTGPG